MNVPTARFVQLKRLAGLLWLALVLSLVLFFALNPDLLAAEALQGFFLRFESQLWLAYVLISAFRGFVLIPSTPFVLVGLLLFPAQGWWVFAVSLFGLAASASFLYFFADWLGLQPYLEGKYPQKTARLAQVFQHRYAFLLVVAWAFFPLVPTDLICYIARLVKMPYAKMMLGILLGEAGLILALMFLL